MVTHCKHCGAELPEGRSFCLACGKPQRSEPVVTPPLRHRSRLIWPVLLLAAVIVCSPLLRRPRDAVFLPAEKPAAPAVMDSPVTALKSPQDAAVPAPDEAGQKEPENSEAADPGQPGQTDPLTPSRTVQQPTVTPSPANSGTSQEPEPAPITPDPQPAADPTPESDSQPVPKQPAEPEPEEPSYEDGSIDQLDHWIQTAREIPPDKVLTLGTTYCIARPGDPGQMCVLFVRLGLSNDKTWYRMFFGGLKYYDDAHINDAPSYNTALDETAYDAVFNGVTYHWRGQGWYTAGGTGGYAPSDQHRFITFGGGTVIEEVLSGGTVVQGPVLSHYGDPPLCNGYYDSFDNMERYRSGTFIPRTDPGFLRVVDELFQQFASNSDNDSFL